MSKARGRTLTFGPHAIEQVQRRCGISRAAAVTALTEIACTIGQPDHAGEYQYWWRGHWLVCLVRGGHICTVWLHPQINPATSRKEVTT